MGWKEDVGKVVQYRVKDGMELPALEGTVGPQIDLKVDQYLPGGGKQFQFVLPEGKTLMDYVDIVSIRSIK